jgi:hypothetical protein
MTNPDEGRETRIVSVRDRTIVVRRLIDTQLMLLAREAKVLQRDDIGMDRKMNGIDRMFRILESAIAQESDREYLEDLMVAGELDLNELLSFVTAFGDKDEAEQKPKVRRGRQAISRN